MPVQSFSTNDKAFQADARARARQSITDLDQARGPLDEYRAKLQAKPKPQCATALMEAFRAKHPEAHLTDEELELAGRAWRCTECDEVHLMPRCCGAPLIRAGVRFFADRPHLLKQFKEVKPNGHDATKNTPDATENGIAVRGRPPTGTALTSTERSRKHRAKRTAAAQNGGGLIDELFPKDSPACDIDWEAHEPGADAEQHRRAFKWQKLEAERLAVECALLRDGITSRHIHKSDIQNTRKIARYWANLAKKLEQLRRP
jgi:hypothetical protein